MALSRDELIKKINNWRKDKNINLSDDYLDYLDAYIKPKGIDVFVTDDDTGEELDDYTPEFEASQAEVLNDLGLSDNEIDEIMGNSISDNSDATPDDPDKLSDKPHDKGLVGEITPEEDFMQRAAVGKIPVTSGILAGDLTPEEIEMIQMMRAGKKPPKSNGLAGETTPEENEMLNITNRLAKNLSKHRW